MKEPVTTELKMKLMPIFQMIGYAQTGVEHGHDEITDRWLTRLKQHADRAQEILGGIVND